MYVCICKDSAAPAHARTRAHRPAAQKSRNSIAVVRVTRIDGGNKGMIDSCTHKTSERISCIIGIGIGQAAR